MACSKLAPWKKKVIKEKRYTLADAISNIPAQQAAPEKVTDVVMLTGVNDIKHDHATIPDVINQMDKTCAAYHNHFPKARIHVGSVAPSNAKHIQYNRQLRDLAFRRQAPIISVDAMMDRDSGHIRNDLLNGIHYTNKGIRILAKEIKRSLYSNRSVRDIPSRPNTPRFAVTEKNSNTDSTDCTVGQTTPNPRQEVAKFLNMAMMRLGSL